MQQAFFKPAEAVPTYTFARIRDTEQNIVWPPSFIATYYFPHMWNLWHAELFAYYLSLFWGGINCPQDMDKNDFFCVLPKWKR